MSLNPKKRYISQFFLRAFLQLYEFLLKIHLWCFERRLHKWAKQKMQLKIIAIFSCLFSLAKPQS